MESLLVCPHCGLGLTRSPRTYACPRGHSFDVAAAGYVNLLAGRPPAVGDNREMIAARKRTLERGVYRPLLTALSRVAREADAERFLDVGCGEGYYTEALAAHAPRSVAIDISRDALRAAARRVCHTELAVASAYHLPIAEGSVTLASVIFAPLATGELTRVLTKGGSLLLAFPGRRHLFSLKQVLYKTPYENEVAPLDGLDGFSLTAAEEVCFPFRLEGQDAILDLFAMTPYFYRTPREGRERLSALSALDLEAEFHVALYRRN